MSSANFKLKRTAAASRGFLATARFSCYIWVVIKLDFFQSFAVRKENKTNSELQYDKYCDKYLRSEELIRHRKQSRKIWISVCY